MPLALALEVQKLPIAILATKSLKSCSIRVCKSKKILQFGKITRHNHGFKSQLYYIVYVGSQFVAQAQKVWNLSPMSQIQ